MSTVDEEWSSGGEDEDDPETTYSKSGRSSIRGRVTDTESESEGTSLKLAPFSSRSGKEESDAAAQKKEQDIELLLIPRQTSVERTKNYVPKPKEALPTNPLPRWYILSLDEKIPLVPAPHGTFVNTRNEISKPIFLHKNIVFDIWDPYIKETPHEYNPLHDPHLKYFFQTQHKIVKRLIHLGLLTKKGEVTCNLAELNQYRVYLGRTHKLQIQAQRTREDEWESCQRKQRKHLYSSVLREMRLRRSDLSILRRLQMLKDNERKARHIRAKWNNGTCQDAHNRRTLELLNAKRRRDLKKLRVALRVAALREMQKKRIQRIVTHILCEQDLAEKWREYLCEEKYVNRQADLKCFVDNKRKYQEEKLRYHRALLRRDRGEFKCRVENRRMMYEMLGKKQKEFTHKQLVRSRQKKERDLYLMRKYASHWRYLVDKTHQDGLHKSTWRVRNTIQNANKKLQDLTKCKGETFGNIIGNLFLTGQTREDPLQGADPPTMAAVHEILGDLVDSSYATLIDRLTNCIIDYAVEEAEKRILDYVCREGVEPLDLRPPKIPRCKKHQIKLEPPAHPCTGPCAQFGKGRDWERKCDKMKKELGMLHKELTKKLRKKLRDRFGSAFDNDDDAFKKMMVFVQSSPDMDTAIDTVAGIAMDRASPNPANPKMQKEFADFAVNRITKSIEPGLQQNVNEIDTRESKRREAQAEAPKKSLTKRPSKTKAASSFAAPTDSESKTERPSAGKKQPRLPSEEPIKANETKQIQQPDSSKEPAETDKDMPKEPSKPEPVTSKVPVKTEEAVSKEPPKSDQVPPKETAKPDEMISKKQTKMEEIPPKEPKQTNEGPSKEPTKAGDVASKQPEKAGEVTSKEPEKAAEVPSKEPTKAAEVTSKEPEKAAEVPSKEPTKEGEVISKKPEKAAEIPSKEPTKEGEVISKKPEKAAEVPSKEPTKEGEVISKKPEKAAEVSSKEPTKEGEVTSKEPEKAAEIPSKEPTEAGKVSHKELKKAGEVPSQEPEKAAEVPSKEPTKAGDKEPEKVGEVPSKEPEKAGEVASKEPEKAEEVPSKEPEKAEEVPSKEPEKAEVPSKEPEKAEKAPSKEPEKVAEVSFKELQKAVEVVSKEPEKVAEVPSKEPEKAGEVAFKEPEKVAEVPSKEPEKVVEVFTKEPEKAGEVAFKEPEKVAEVPSKEPEKVVEVFTKEPEKAGQVPSKEPEKVAEVPFKELQKAVEVVSKEPEKVAEVPSKEPEKAGEVASKEPEKVAEVTSKEPEKVGEVPFKEPEKAREAATKEPEKVAEVASQEPEKAGKVASKKPEKAEEVPSKEPEKAGEVASKEPEKVAEVTSKEPEKLAEVASKEPEKAGEVASKEPEKVAEVTFEDPEKVAEVASKEPEKVAEVISKEPEKVAEVASKEPEKVAEVASKEPEKVAEITFKEPEKAEEVPSKEPEKAGQVASKEPEKVAEVTSKEPEKVAEVASKEPAKVAEVASKEPGKVSEVASIKPEKTGEVPPKEPEKVGKVPSKGPEKVGEVPSKKPEKSDKVSSKEYETEALISSKEPEKADEVISEEPAKSVEAPPKEPDKESQVTSKASDKTDEFPTKAFQDATAEEPIAELRQEFADEAIAEEPTTGLGKELLEEDIVEEPDLAIIAPEEFELEPLPGMRVTQPEIDDECYDVDAIANEISRKALNRAIQRECLAKLKTDEVCAPGKIYSGDWSRCISERASEAVYTAICAACGKVRMETGDEREKSGGVWCDYSEVLDSIAAQIAKQALDSARGGLVAQCQERIVSVRETSSPDWSECVSATVSQVVRGAICSACAKLNKENEDKKAKILSTICEDEGGQVLDSMAEEITKQALDKAEKGTKGLRARFQDEDPVSMLNNSRNDPSLQTVFIPITSGESSTTSSAQVLLPARLLPTQSNIVRHLTPSQLQNMTMQVEDSSSAYGMGGATGKMDVHEGKSFMVQSIAPSQLMQVPGPQSVPKPPSAPPDNCGFRHTGDIFPAEVRTQVQAQLRLIRAEVDHLTKTLREAGVLQDPPPPKP